MRPTVCGGSGRDELDRADGAALRSVTNGGHLWVAAGTNAAPLMVRPVRGFVHTAAMRGTARDPGSDAAGADSRTVRNVAAQPWVRVSLGAVRDVVLVHGTAEVIALTDLSTSEADLFSARSGFDPRTLGEPHVYVRVTPRRMQAWREENELAGREILHDGRWLG